MTYTYYSTQRPAGPGAVPALRDIISIEDMDPRQIIPAIQRGAYSRITYRRPLTPTEIDAYELTPDPEQGRE